MMVDVKEGEKSARDTAKAHDEGLDYKKLKDLASKTKDMTSGAANTGLKYVDRLKDLAPSNITIGFIVAIAADLFDYYSGLNIGGLTSFGIHAVTFIILTFLGFGLKYSLIAGSLEYLLPVIFATAQLPTGFITFSLAFPFWILFAIIVWRESGIKSKTITTFVVVAGIVFFLVLLPSIPTINDLVPSVQYTQSRIAVEQTKDFISTTYTNTVNYIGEEKIYYTCTIAGGSDQTCKQQAFPQEEQLKQVLKINPILDTDFKMDIVNFVQQPFQVPDDGKITNYVPIFSNVEGSKVSYGCGVKEAENIGTTEPSNEPIGIITRSGTENSILCKLDLSKTKIRELTYQFNATASGITSSGYKKMVFVGATKKESAINSVLSNIQSEFDASSESARNQLLSESSDFSGLISEWRKSDLFTPAVGKEDLVQPVIQDGFINQVGSESPLIYGIPGKPINFAVFVRNNGNGRISKITDVRFTLPPDIQFDKPNCGITPETLANTNFRSTLIDQYKALPSCNILFVGKLANPNIAEVKQISVSITYDYVISKEQMVTA